MERKKAYKNILMIVIMLVFLFSWCSVAYAEERSVLLKDMPIEDKNECHILKEELRDSYGNSYSGNVVNMNPEEDAYLIYNLDGQYSRLAGSIVIITKSDISIAIYGDGKALYSKTGFTEQEDIQEFDIDVTGVGRLEILSESHTAGDLFLTDVKFIEAEERTVPGSYAKLEEMTVTDSADFKQKICLQKDTFGNLHRGRHLFNNQKSSDTESYAFYNLEQRYESFSGNLIVGEESKNECNMNVQIYLDDQLVFEQNGMGKTSEPVKVDLDVKSAEVMKIKVTGKEGYLCVVDDILERHEHTPGEWEIEEEASCNKTGKKVQLCTECKEVCNTQEIETLEHEPGEWTVEREATCQTTGEEAVYCKNCGEWLDVRELPLVEHKEEEEWFVQEEPSCTFEGTRVKRCVYCGETITVEKIPKTKHKFGKWVTVEGSVWNAPIVKTRICSGCFTEETKNVYAWVWVKPVVILLVILGALIGVIVILMYQRGIQITLENIKEFCRYGIKDIKYKPKDNESGGDIFSSRGRSKKNNNDDDIFNSYH